MLILLQISWIIKVQLERATRESQFFEGITVGSSVDRFRFSDLLPE